MGMGGLWGLVVKKNSGMLSRVLVFPPKRQRWEGGKVALGVLTIGNEGNLGEKEHGGGRRNASCGVSI